MNEIMLVGRLVRDPSLVYVQDNELAVAKFIIAVDRYGKERKTDFIPITTFRKQAENVSKYVRKGSLVGITGKICSSNYENPDGGKIYKIEVVANNVRFLSSPVNDKNRNAELDTENKEVIGERISDGKQENYPL